MAALTSGPSGSLALASRLRWNHSLCSRRSLRNWLTAALSLLSMPLLAHFPETQAALGPPSVSLLIGAFVFGLCMQIADGCGSGTLYKAGMGIPMNTAILPLFAIGSFLGSLHLGWWLDLGNTAPVGLVTQWGWAPALIATLDRKSVV